MVVLVGVAPGFFRILYHLKMENSTNWGNEQNRKIGGEKTMVFSLAERRRIGGLKIELVRYNMRFCMLPIMSMIQNSLEYGS